MTRRVRAPELTTVRGTNGGPAETIPFSDLPADRTRVSVTVAATGSFDQRRAAIASVYGELVARYPRPIGHGIGEQCV